MIPGTSSIFSFDTVHRGSNIFSHKREINDRFGPPKPVEREAEHFNVLVEYMPGSFKTIAFSMVCTLIVYLFKP